MGFNSGNSYIATEAAIGIDMYLRGEKNVYGTPCNEIASKLEKMSTEEVFPEDITILAPIYWPNKEDWKGKKTEDLQEKAALFSTQLRNYKSLSQEKQEELKANLIKLSDSISTNMYEPRFRSCIPI